MGRDGDEDPKEQLKQGFGLLWRAARGAATELKKDLDRSGVGKTLDDAGRELARAATNVIGRIGSEIQKVQRPETPPAKAKEDGDAGEEPGGTKPTGPTKSDPGFRIADPDDPGKDGKPQ